MVIAIYKISKTEAEFSRNHCLVVYKYVYFKVYANRNASQFKLNG